MSLFSDLVVSKELLKAIKDLDYIQPTEIQSQLIPLIIKNYDVLGQAHTGSGKTASFLIPLIEKINITTNDCCPQVIILCPTRELVKQTYDEYKKFAKYILKIKAIAIYGGKKILFQINELRKKPQIIIATPGRLLDHLKRKTICANNIKSIVLDEADEMLNMGFRKDILKIFSYINHKHQTILLSATMPYEILEISKTIQKNPQKVKIQKQGSDLPKINQKYLLINEENKSKCLIYLLQKIANHDLSNLIFVKTKLKANKINDLLKRNKINCDVIHSDLSQNKREKTMNLFRRGIIKSLVATDIAARGIDIKNIKNVFNYDMPENIEQYVHRIGRTSRANEFGNSYSFVLPNQVWLIKEIERKYKVNIDKIVNKFSIKNLPLNEIKNEKSLLKFWINLGKKDKFENDSLNSFIFQKTKVTVNRLEMYGTHSYIWVAKNDYKKIINIFNAKLNDRKIVIKKINND